LPLVFCGTPLRSLNALRINCSPSCDPPRSGAYRLTAARRREGKETSKKKTPILFNE
jgi:hypothetical protein